MPWMRWRWRSRRSSSSRESGALPSGSPVRSLARTRTFAVRVATSNAKSAICSVCDSLWRYVSRRPSGEKRTARGICQPGSGSFAIRSNGIGLASGPRTRRRPRWPSMRASRTMSPAIGCRAARASAAGRAPAHAAHPKKPVATSPASLVIHPFGAIAASALARVAVGIQAPCGPGPSGWTHRPQGSAVRAARSRGGAVPGSSAEVL